MQADSVSEWIDGVKQGDRAAQTMLWRRYYGLLIEEARQLLAKRYRPRPRGRRRGRPAKRLRKCLSPR